jgi:hypothetical protein
MPMRLSKHLNFSPLIALPTLLLLGPVAAQAADFGSPEWARASLLGALGMTIQPQDAEPSKAVSDGAVIRVRASGWFTQLTGEGNFGEPIPGTTTQIDLTDTLGLDDDKVALSASVGINLGKQGRWHFDGGFNGPFNYDGTSDPINISFNDFQFTGIVESEADINIYQFDLGYDIIKSSPFTLTIGPGGRLVDIEASVTGTASENGTGATEVRTETVDALVPLPGLGLGARVDLTPNIYAKAFGRGIYLGNLGNYFDASAELGYDLGKNFGLFAGYRWMHIEADVDDVDFEVDLKGFYAGVELRF